MRQLGTEEKAALLLTPIDDDDDDEEIDQSTKTHRDQFTTVTKRPRTSYRTRTNSSHPVLVFMLILSAFIFGCLSGVVIMIYRISQDAERTSTTNIDLSIQTKLSQTITKTNFLHLNFSTESLNESAKKLEQTWQTYPKVFKQIKQISYDLTLTKYAPSNQWSGIQLIDENKNKELTNFNLILTNEYLTYSSLIKSGQFDGKFICYVNYGRDEDLAYLFQQNIIQYENHRQTIVFMRRKSTIISQTEQIRQGIRYEFGGIVLFDDDNDQQNEQFQINNRQSIIDQWKHLSKNPKFLEDFSIDHEQQILLLTLSNSDVENIFSAIPSDSNQWPTIPEQWYSKSKVLKLGGHIQDYKLRMSSFIQEIPVQLPVLIGQIRGDIEPEKFIILGYQLGEKQQETIVNEIIRAFNAQMTNGWKPRRSILICAWSDLTSDHFTVERWINENKDFIEQNLIGYFDLADGIQANTTLNLHGSPLFEQIATRTADFVVSPLVHDHVCHHRQTHIHRKRRHDDHNQPSQMNSDGDECQPHKLLDEWIRTTKTRFQSNQTFPIVQLIDSHSRASIFQLKYGIPSLTIEMTDLQFIDNQTFYSKKLRSTYSNEIQPEIFVSYTQFLAELIRQFIDQPLIPFNLTNYADLIDTQTSEYFAHFDRSYRWLISTLGDSNEMSQLINDLTKSIRQNQRTIDQTSKDLIQIQQSNQKLAQFEHLFLSEKSKHLFIGPAYGLTNTVVSYPTLSNLLYNMTSNPPQEFLDAIKYHWLNLRKQIQLIRKTLNGFDGLLTK